MTRKKSNTPYQDAEIEGQLEMWGRATMDGDAADWTALDELPLGGLIRALVAADAGLMFRAAEQRSALAVGMFLGGQKKWQTARDQRELLACLESALELLERAAGARLAPPPTPLGAAALGLDEVPLVKKGAKRRPTA